MHYSSPLPVYVLSRDAKAYAAILRADYLHLINVVSASASPDALAASDIRILLGDPDLTAKVIPECDNLLWCQSTWAGNKPILALTKRDYHLTGVKGIFGRQMREYVFAYTLHHLRAINDFAERQRAGQWQHPSFTSLAGKTMGILGAGSIANALLPVARAFELNVIGLSRSGKIKNGYARMYSAKERLAFASQCDVMVNLMPDTPDTTHVIDAAFLDALPSHALIINSGRGSAIDDDALIAALDSGSIAAAVLDVFSEEPLPADHPFWHHKKVTMTMHTAAMSAPEDVLDVFIHNAKRLINGQPLHYLFDFDKGY